MTKLLLDEVPLQVLPSLAALLGVDEAIVLQQIHWLAQREGVERDGRRWLSGNQDLLRAQFPWLSLRTLQRIVPSLIERGALLLDQPSGFNRTAWYAVDKQALEALHDAMPPNWRDGSRQIGGIDTAKVAGCSIKENIKTENIAAPDVAALEKQLGYKPSASSEEMGGFEENTPEHVAARLCSKVDKLMADGRPVSSGRTRATLAAGVRKAMETAAEGNFLAPGPAGLLAALDRMAREPYWATQMLAMATWTRPAAWLRMYADYLRLAKPLPRATAPAAPRERLVAVDPYGGGA